MPSNERAVPGQQSLVESRSACNPLLTRHNPGLLSSRARHPSGTELVRMATVDGAMHIIPLVRLRALTTVVILSRADFQGLL
jgi:hypothetical protein